MNNFGIKFKNKFNIYILSLIMIVMFISVLIKPFAWVELIIAFNIFTSIPFIISGALFLKEIEKQNTKKIKLICGMVYLYFWLPSLSLPFFYELGGIIISLIILLMGIIGVFIIKNPISKISFLNI